jgi:hypothetical protein
MHIPLLQDVLGIEPVSRVTWLVVAGIAFIVIPAIEIHKWTWAVRHRYDAYPNPS